MLNKYFAMLYDLSDFMMVHYEESLNRHSPINVEIFTALCLSFCQGWSCANACSSVYVDNFDKILAFIEKSLKGYFKELSHNEN